jgi:hypothetical protein
MIVRRIAAAIFFVAFWNPGCQPAPTAPGPPPPPQASFASDAAATTGNPAASAPLPNGLYTVVRDALDSSATSDDRLRVVPFDPPPSDDADAGRARVWVVLDRQSYVPLILEAPPATENDVHGRPLLTVALAPQYVHALEELTRANLNGGRVAVVLDGVPITIHKVRSVISGGKMQITRCTDRACDVIRSKLLEHADGG